MYVPFGKSCLCLCASLCLPKLNRKFLPLSVSVVVVVVVVVAFEAYALHLAGHRNSVVYSFTTELAITHFQIDFKKSAILLCFGHLFEHLPYTNRNTDHINVC